MKVFKEKGKEIINNLNRDYCKNYRTTFTKQFIETLDLPDVENIAKQQKKTLKIFGKKHALEGKTTSFFYLCDRLTFLITFLLLQTKIYP